MRKPRESDAYIEATSGLEVLAQVVAAALTSLMSETVVLHSTPSRIKTKESADRKMLASPTIYRSYSDLHDLLGMRVITLFEDDLDKAEAAIRRVLRVDPARSGDKIERYKPNEFGYRSRHFVGTLRPDRLKLPENKEFEGKVLEIQLRSILQHAWAEVEHDLGYRPGRPIGDSQRRRFSQLAAVMELADQGFSNLRLELSDAESNALTKYAPSSAPLLSIATLDAYVRKDAKFKAFDRLVALKLESNLSPVGTGMRERVGYLLDLASSVGWRTVSDVAKALEQYRDRGLTLADGLSADQRSLLEIPSGQGLRPGFSLILLAEAAISDTERS